MPSLLPSCVIPETMKTSCIVIDSYDEGQMQGVFSNFNTAKDIVFNNTMDLLFEIDSMLEAYLSSISHGVLDKFSFEALEQFSDSMNRVRYEQADNACAFFIKIWFVRNAQWKGSVEWINGEERSDFKTIPELMTFMTNILDKATYKVFDTEKIG